MTKQALTKKRIIFDEGSGFVSQVIKELAETLGITLEIATNKHAQTFAVLERTHELLKKAVKIGFDAKKSM